MEVEDHRLSMNQAILSLMVVSLAIDLLIVDPSLLVEWKGLISLLSRLYTHEALAEVTVPI